MQNNKLKTPGNAEKQEGRIRLYQNKWPNESDQFQKNLLWKIKTQINLYQNDEEKEKYREGKERLLIQSKPHHLIGRQWCVCACVFVCVCACVCKHKHIT